MKKLRREKYTKYVLTDGNYFFHSWGYNKVNLTKDIHDACDFSKDSLLRPSRFGPTSDEHYFNVFLTDMLKIFYNAQRTCLLSEADYFRSKEIEIDKSKFKLKKVSLVTTMKFENDDDVKNNKFCSDFIKSYME